MKSARRRMVWLFVSGIFVFHTHHCFAVDWEEMEELYTKNMKSNLSEIRAAGPKGDKLRQQASETRAKILTINTLLGQDSMIERDFSMGKNLSPEERRFLDEIPEKYRNLDGLTRMKTGMTHRYIILTGKELNGTEASSDSLNASISYAVKELIAVRKQRELAVQPVFEGKSGTGTGVKKTLSTAPTDSDAFSLSEPMLSVLDSKAPKKLKRRDGFIDMGLVETKSGNPSGTLTQREAQHPTTPMASPRRTSDLGELVVPAIQGLGSLNRSPGLSVVLPRAPNSTPRYSLGQEGFDSPVFDRTAISTRIPPKAPPTSPRSADKTPPKAADKYTVDNLPGAVNGEAGSAE